MAISTVIRPQPALYEAFVQDELYASYRHF